jgi:hypothetical protein
MKIMALAKSLMAEEMRLVAKDIETVQSVKETLQRKLGVSADELVLVCRGKEMKDEAPLAEYRAMSTDGVLVAHLLYRPIGPKEQPKEQPKAAPKAVARAVASPAAASHVVFEMSASTTARSSTLSTSPKLSASLGSRWKMLTTSTTSHDISK